MISMGRCDETTRLWATLRASAGGTSEAPSSLIAMASQHWGPTTTEPSIAGVRRVRGPGSGAGAGAGAGVRGPGPGPGPGVSPPAAARRCFSELKGAPGPRRHARKPQRAAVCGNLPTPHNPQTGLCGALRPFCCLTAPPPDHRKGTRASGARLGTAGRAGQTAIGASALASGDRCGTILPVRPPKEASPRRPMFISSRLSRSLLLPSRAGTLASFEIDPESVHIGSNCPAQETQDGQEVVRWEPQLRSQQC